MANNYLALITVENGLVQSLQFRAITSGDVTAALGFTPSNLGTPVSVANGGTNSGTALNNHRVMVSSGGAIVEAGPLADGQLLIGTSGSSPAAANLSAGTGITITNSPGAVEVSASLAPPVGFNGRLTLTSLTPVTTADVTAAGTLYLTPFRGNVGFYTDGIQTLYAAFGEVSLALSGLTSGKNYDVFFYLHSGALFIDLGPAWSSDTSRGTGAGTTQLGLVNGFWSNQQQLATLIHGHTVAINQGTYVGTIRTTGATTTEDSAVNRFVWNNYNRLPRGLSVQETTANWTYTTATFRSANGSTSNRVNVVRGLEEEPVSLRVDVDFKNGTAAVNANAGVGVDSTSVNSAQAFGGACPAGGFGTAHAVYVGFPGLGFHFLQWLEESDAAGSTVWFGTNAGGLAKGSGITGTMPA